MDWPGFLAHFDAFISIVLGFITKQKDFSMGISFKEILGLLLDNADVLSGCKRVQREYS